MRLLQSPTAVASSAFGRLLDGTCMSLANSSRPRLLLRGGAWDRMDHWADATVHCQPGHTHPSCSRVGLDPKKRHPLDPRTPCGPCSPCGWAVMARILRTPVAKGGLHLCDSPPFSSLSAGQPFKPHHSGPTASDWRLPPSHAGPWLSRPPLNLRVLTPDSEGPGRPREQPGSSPAGPSVQRCSVRCPEAKPEPDHPAQSCLGPCSR
jgi:hypothetical protein